MFHFMTRSQLKKFVPVPHSEYFRISICILNKRFCRQPRRAVRSKNAMLNRGLELMSTKPLYFLIGSDLSDGFLQKKNGKRKLGLPSHVDQAPYPLEATRNDGYGQVYEFLDVGVFIAIVRRDCIYLIYIEILSRF